MESGKTESSVGLGGTTANASANTKGNFSQRIAATSIDFDGLLLGLRATGNAAGHSTLTDLAIGAAGAEQVIISNMLADNNDTTVNRQYHFYAPIFIPKGSRISTRIQSTVGAEVGNLFITGCSYGFTKPHDALTKCETNGANTADSGGVTVDPGAVTGEKGAYSQIAASINMDFHYIVVLLSWRGNIAGTGQRGRLDIAVGAAGQEVIICKDLIYYTATGTGFDTLWPCVFEFWCSIPKGSRISVRAESTINDATDRLIDVAILGFG